jgi:hypothetical protein
VVVGARSSSGSPTAPVALPKRPLKRQFAKARLGEKTGRWKSMCWASGNPALAIKIAATFLEPAGVALDMDERRPGFIVLRLRDKEDRKT